MPANWKLGIENFKECYHCGPAHHDFARAHSIKDPDGTHDDLIAALCIRSHDVGLSVEALQHYQSGTTSYWYDRYPFLDGYLTGRQTGAPVAPLLGDLRGYDGGVTDLQIGHLNNFIIYSDYVVGFRFVPAASQ